MTRDEILALEAGRELDALVAEIMGWTRYQNKHGLIVMSRPGAIPSHAHFDQHPNFSTDIAAALEVVEKMTAEGHGYFELCKDFGGWWNATFFIVLSNDDERRALGYGNWKYESDGNTAPLAICRAALLAVMT